jgi:LPXTG-motif cell wall-anchored protein
MSFFVPLGVSIAVVDLPVLAVFPSTGTYLVLYVGIAIAAVGGILTLRSSRNGS